MPVNKDKRIIFVHIPKCAGTSVNEFMDIIFPTKKSSHSPKVNGEPMDVLYGGTVLEHMTAAEIRETLGAESFEALDSFAVIRNPWDRMVSFYEYIMKLTVPVFGKDFLKDFTFDEFVEIVQKHPFFKPFYPQHVYLFDDSGKLMVRRIFRFEDTASLKEYLAKHMNKSVEKFPHANVTTRRPYQSYYNPHTKQIVQDIYRRDIELFGYHFDGQPKQLSMSSDPNIPIRPVRLALCTFILKTYMVYREGAIIFVKSQDRIRVALLWTVWGLLVILILVFLLWMLRM